MMWTVATHDELMQTNGGAVPDGCTETQNVEQVTASGKRYHIVSWVCPKDGTGGGQVTW